MSANKKIRQVATHVVDSSANPDSRQPEDDSLVREKPGIKMSLKERVRLMLTYPEAQVIYDEADVDDEMQTPISDFYRTLNNQSVSTAQMCMDAELRAISAIEERMTTELRLIEADYECISMEMHARKALAEKLQQAEKAIAEARAKEYAALNNLDTVKAGPEMGDGKSMEQQLQVLAQKRQDAEIRVHKMQRIRMDAEQCAIHEIGSIWANEDLLSCDIPNQCLSEESILQMALENGLLATQSHSHTSQDGQSMEHIGAECEVDRLLDDIRNTSWKNLFIGSPTLH